MIYNIPMEIFDVEHSVLSAVALRDGVDFINEFSDELQRYDNRVTGSANETACARAIRRRLVNETDATVRLEAYKAYPLMGRGSLPFYGLWCLLCYVLYFVSFAGNRLAGILLTILALGVYLIGCVAMIMMHFGKHKFKKFMSQKVSYNVVSEFSKNTDKLKKERTFIICDNHDAVLGNFLTDYRPMSKAAYVFIPLTCVVFVLFCILKMALGTDTPTKITAFTVVPAVIGVLGITVTILRFSPFDKHAKQNNGIATAVAMATYAYFAEQPELLPDDVRLVYVSFGGENSAHGGSEAFVKSHPEFARAGVLCVGDIESSDIKIAERNSIRRIQYSIPLVSLIRSSAHEQNIDITALPTDKLSQKFASLHGYMSDAFAQNGNPTATIVAEDRHKDSTLPENNDIEKLLSVTVGAFMKFIRETNQPTEHDSSAQPKKATTEMEIHSAVGK